MDVPLHTPTVLPAARRSPGPVFEFTHRKKNASTEPTVDERPLKIHALIETTGNAESERQLIMAESEPAIAAEMR
jgi:hypothetical protein